MDFLVVKLISYENNLLKLIFRDGFFFQLVAVEGTIAPITNVSFEKVPTHFESMTLVHEDF